VLRIALLATYQREALFFPRWMPDLVLGYGYPLLSFMGRPPISWPASCAGGRRPGAGAVDNAAAAAAAGRQESICCCSTSSGLPRAGDAMPPHWSARPGYLYAPYLLLNLYARGAVAEVGAQMLLPWILWALRRIFYASHPAPYLLIFALTTALLALYRQHLAAVHAARSAALCAGALLADPLCGPPGAGSAGSPCRRWG
jgi:hypothetical protein